MAHFNVTVPDNKIQFFKELLDSLNFSATEIVEENEISDEHKKQLDQRMKDYEDNPDLYLNWEDVQKDIEKRI